MLKSNVDNAIKQQVAQLFFSKKILRMKSQKKKNRKKKSLKVLHTCIILKREEIGKDRFDFAQSYINVTNINKKYMEDKIEINGNETDKKALEPFSLQPPTSLKVEENEYMQPERPSNYFPEPYPYYGGSYPPPYFYMNGPGNFFPEEKLEKGVSSSENSPCIKKEEAE